MAMEILLLLFLVAMTAGFVDTLAGGGGMLTLPALFLAGIPADAVLGTNKLQASFGSASASWYFIRQGKIQLSAIWKGLLATAIGAGLGALMVQILPIIWLQKILPLALLTIAVILIKMPKMGEIESASKISPTAFLLGVALPIGFYDGFLGPGTGSFFLMAMVALSGLTLQQATIQAKIYNATTNLVALGLFLIGGKIIWVVGLIMALGQFIGAQVASRLILLKGNALIRPMAIGVSVCMSLVLAYRYWF